jgi:hypothetical protein
MPWRAVFNPFAFNRTDWNPNYGPELSRHALEMKRRVQCVNSRLVPFAHHHRNTAVVERHLTRLIRPKAEQPRQVRAIDDVMAYNEDRFPFVMLKQFFESGCDAIVDIRKGLAAGIALFSGVGNEALVAIRVETSNGLPIEAFPSTDVTLGESLQWLRDQAVRLGDDGGGLHRAKQRTAITVIDWPDRQEVARGLGLADAQGRELRVVATALQPGRVGQVRFRCSVSNQV